MVVDGYNGGMTGTYFGILLIVLLGGFIVLFLTLRQKGAKKEDGQSLLLLQNQLQELRSFAGTRIPYETEDDSSG